MKRRSKKAEKDAGGKRVQENGVTQQNDDRQTDSVKEEREERLESDKKKKRKSQKEEQEERVESDKKKKRKSENEEREERVEFDKKKKRKSEKEEREERVESEKKKKRKSENDTKDAEETVKPDERSKKADKRKSVLFSKKNDNEEKQESKEEDSEEEESSQFEVKSVLKEKKIKGVRHYLIRWKGYGPKSDTWEPESTLNCSDLIKEFHNSTKDGAKKVKKVKRELKRPKDSKDKDWDENEQFEVDRILEMHIKRNGSREFLVSWKGYPQSQNSWEPEENLECPDLIKQFMVEEAKNVGQKQLKYRTPTKRMKLTMKKNSPRLS